MEELVKEFEEKEGLYAYFESDSGVIEYNSYFVEWMAKQLALLRVSNWVACKDKLPSYYDSFLVVWQKDVLQLFFDPKEKIWHTHDMEEYKKVTHWMELPEPPCLLTGLL